MYTLAQQKQITRDNLRRQEREISSGLEVRISYLADLAEILRDMIGESTPSFDALCNLTSDEPLLSPCDRALHRELLPEHRAAVATALAHLAVYDRVTLCRLLLEKWETAGTPLTLAALLRCETRPGKISYFRTALTDEAFDGFAADLPAPTAAFALDYADSCETVAAGEADYCILPLATREGGRAESVCALFRTYGLRVVATRVIFDGEDDPVTFALCGRAPLREWEDPCLMLTLPEAPQDAPAALTAAAAYTGMQVTRLTYDGHLCMETQGGDPGTFLVFLCLFYPDFRVDGYYSDGKEELR